MTAITIRTTYIDISCTRCFQTVEYVRRIHYNREFNLWTPEDLPKNYVCRECREKEKPAYQLPI